MDWKTTLRFRNRAYPDIALRDRYPWPALFYISPDDHWILQVQKVGSGESFTFLYRLDPDARLWAMEQRFDELAFTFLKHSRGVAIENLYHKGIEFLSWDQKIGVLRFIIRGKFVEKSGEGIREELVYDLHGHKFSRR